MSSIYQQALTGVNETITTIRLAQTDIPAQPQYLTLASFSGSDAMQVNNITLPASFWKILKR